MTRVWATRKRATTKSREGVIQYRDCQYGIVRAQVCGSRLLYQRKHATFPRVPSGKRWVYVAVLRPDEAPGTMICESSAHPGFVDR